ncbi:MAG: DHH family phosphoesterase [Lachnospiraceae bacterium]|nr:DHH family phosphoesterase [Lachnospiraceae bacterium]
MRLADLEKYNQIVIQVHDNPDADAVGSGYAIYRYFQEKGKEVRLVYGGKYAIGKSNMLLLIEELEIPIEYIQELEQPELLITVDCQYGEGNVQYFEAQNIAMIDHHNTGRQSDNMTEIRSHLVSCSTVCYALLKEAGFDVNKDVKISTALYYGLFMDSNQLAEISHPYDRDMVEFLEYDKNLLNRLKYANLNIEDFETAGIAILRHNYVEKHRLAIINSKACDPNILGLIGDLALQVESIDVGIVYSEYPGGYKLSIRSCLLEVAANELAGFLTEGIGDGGGHIDKAGGFISEARFEELYDNQSIEGYFFQRMDEYFESYEVVNYNDGRQNKDAFKRYRKKSAIYGFVKLGELFEEGTECKIRTLEGDVFVTANKNTYVMIGREGEVYPIEKEVFEGRYNPLEEDYDREFDYKPSIINMTENRAYDLLPYAKQCVSQPGAQIWAKPLELATKVFSRWNYETYMYGRPGDFLCYSANDEKDVYVVKQESFPHIYEVV